MNNTETKITITEVLSRADAAKYLTISPGSLDKLPLPRITIGRRVIFKKADIDMWLETQKGQKQKVVAV